MDTINRYRKFKNGYEHIAV